MVTNRTSLCHSLAQVDAQQTKVVAMQLFVELSKAFERFMETYHRAAKPLISFWIAIL